MEGIISKSCYTQGTLKTYWSNYVFFVMFIKNIDSPPKKNNKQKQTTHTQNNKQTHTNKLKKK